MLGQRVTGGVVKVVGYGETRFYGVVSGGKFHRIWLGFRVAVAGLW